MNLYVLNEGDPIPPASSAACAAAGLGSPCWLPNTPRINPNFSTFTEVSSLGQSWYNSLQVNLEKRFSKGLQFNGSYTYAKLEDYGEGMTQFEGGCASSVIADPWNPAYNKGLSDFDLKNSFIFNAQYRIPTLPGDNIGSKFLRGWWLGSIVTIHGGYPLTPTIISSQSQQHLLAAAASDDFDRPNFVTPANLALAQQQDPLAQVYNPNTVILGSPTEWFNPHMFTVQPLGTLGDVPRGIMRGPNFRDWDFSINKDTALPFLGEAGKLEFRAEFFNILNRANFANPAIPGLLANNSVFAGGTAPGVPDAPLPNVGAIYSTISTSRQIQFALKLIF